MSLGEATNAAYGPYRGQDPSVLMQSVADAFRQRGYEPTVDGPRGRVVAPAEYRDARGRTATIVAQVYQGGWVQLRLEGSAVDFNTPDGAAVPPPLQAEYVRLASGFLPASAGGMAGGTP